MTQPPEPPVNERIFGWPFHPLFLGPDIASQQDRKRLK